MKPLQVVTNRLVQVMRKFARVIERVLAFTLVQLPTSRGTTQREARADWLATAINANGAISSHRLKVESVRAGAEAGAMEFSMFWFSAVCFNVFILLRSSVGHVCASRFFCLLRIPLRALAQRR